MSWLDTLHKVVLDNQQGFGAAAGALSAGRGIGGAGAAFAQGRGLDMRRAKMTKQEEMQAELLARQKEMRESMTGANAPAWMQSLDAATRGYIGGNQKLFDDVMQDQISRNLNPAPVPERKMTKAADGYQYYNDDQSRAFPDVQATVDPKTSLDSSKYAMTLRKEFSNESGDFKKITNSYQTIKTAAGRQSGAGDMSMVFAFMKMLDPTSVVREGEFAKAENVGGVPAQVWNQYNKLVSGEFLPQSLRDEFVAMAGDLYKNQKAKYDQRSAFYTDEAKAAGINPNRIIQDFSVGNQPIKGNLNIWGDIGNGVKMRQKN